MFFCHKMKFISEISVLSIKKPGINADSGCHKIILTQSIFLKTKTVFLNSVTLALTPAPYAGASPLQGSGTAQAVPPAKHKSAPKPQKSFARRHSELMTARISLCTAIYTLLGCILMVCFHSGPSRLKCVAIKSALLLVSCPCFPARSL